MKQILVFAFLAIFANLLAQDVKIPVVLREISGLEKLDKNSFVAINDGGNAAEIYVIGTDGSLIKTVSVDGAENVDWEDLASDGTYLYIGDFGNNLNKRKDLCVYKVPLQSIRDKKTVVAEKINFSYTEQNSFPPDANQMLFDAEGFTVYGEKLWIFTKTNDDPWTGMARIYKLPTSPGTYKLTQTDSIIMGTGGWWEDAITGADAYDGIFYLMTYQRIDMYRFIDGHPILQGHYDFPESTQKESILVDGEYIWVADEYQGLLGGGKLYRIPRNEFKSVIKDK